MASVVRNQWPSMVTIVDLAVTTVAFTEVKQPMATQEPAVHITRDTIGFAKEPRH